MDWTSGSNGKVRLAVDDGVAEIRLSHPEKLNCFSLELAEDLRDLTLSIDEYDDVSAVVVTADGRSFSAGADVDIVGGDDSEAGERLQELYGPAFEWMRNEPIPVVAGGRGPIVGAGASVLCYAADLRVVGEDVEIWWPEVAYGIPPLSRLIALKEDVGAPHALELMLLGEDGKMDAEEAHELGLVNRVVAPGDVDSEARRMAETIAAYDDEHGIVEGFLDTLRHARTEQHGGSTAYARYRRDVEQGFRGDGS
jgi:enoyl-CoA hydratase/carnithine racemase